MKRYHIVNYGVVTISQTTQDWLIVSSYRYAILALNSQDLAGSRVVGMSVGGIHAGTFPFSNHWEDCFIKGASGLDGVFKNCIFDPSVGFVSGASLFDCSSFDESVVDIDMNGATQFVLRVFNWSGRIAISNMNHASSKVDIECAAGGQVRIDADVLQLGAGIRIGGTFVLTNASLLSPDLTGRVAEVVDTELSTVHGAGAWDGSAGGLTLAQSTQLQETWTALGLNDAAPMTFDSVSGFVRALANTTPIDIAIAVLGNAVTITRQ